MINLENIVQFCNVLALSIAITNIKLLESIIICNAALTSI